MKKKSFGMHFFKAVCCGVFATCISLCMSSFSVNAAQIQTDSKQSQATQDFVVEEHTEDVDILGIAKGINDDYAWQVLTIVNKERAKVGLPALTMDANMVATANLRAKEIVVSFSHTRPNGQSCFSAFPQSVDYPIGENIAAGYWSPESVMEGWMGSQGHRENILGAGFKSIGIACYYDSSSPYKYNWVQCFGGSVSKKATRPKSTIYDGVDYSAVYDYDYYISHYEDVKKAFGTDYAGALKHFVTSGMKEGRRGNASFDVVSYANANYDLRKNYKNNLKKYYIHYITHGKKEGRKAVNVKKMQGGPTVYKGVDYGAVYQTGYYAYKYPDLKKNYGFDDQAYLTHFVKTGMKEGRQAKSSFNVKKYRNRYPKLKKKYGKDLKKYYLHYINTGKKKGYKGN